jgi:phosphoglycolate phosphatase-like HAD superfamily hydrolase
MKLVMLDIDGTLTQTCSIDSECYVRAVREVGGFRAISTEWTAYRHASDTGILAEIYETQLGRAPSGEELAGIQKRFAELLEEAVEASLDAFAPIPGATEFLAWLRNSGHAIALASGGWERTARLKLATAGLDVRDFPAAFADDAHARTDIMEIAKRRACEFYGRRDLDRVVYLGDGVWDVKASAALGYQFVGIGSGNRAQRLRELGVAEVFADYRDLGAIQGVLS